MNKAFCITEKEISAKLGRVIHSSVKVSNLAFLDLDTQAFLDFFSLLFEEFPWSFYDVKRMQVNFLQIAFPRDRMKIQKLLKPYFLGEISLDSFCEWTDRFSHHHQKAFDKIKPWQRHSVCQFILSDNGNGVEYERVPVKETIQKIEGDDYRSWARIYPEISAKYVDNDLFFDWLKSNYNLVKEIQPRKQYQIRFKAHFMREYATKLRPDEGRREGKGQLISTLIIHQENIRDGESQIIKKQKGGNEEVIFKHIFQAGEFMFQGDSEEGFICELTPPEVGQSRLGKAWRDTIHLEVDVIHESIADYLK